MSEIQKRDSLFRSNIREKGQNSPHALKFPFSKKINLALWIIELKNHYCL